MNNYQLIIVLLSLILIIILFPLYYSLLQIRINYKRIETSVCEVKKLGHSISINAPIRKGKTSLMNGLTNGLEKDFTMRINDEMEKCKKILHYLDFNFINEFLYEKFSSVGQISFFYRKKVFNDLIEACNMSDGIYNDFINNLSLYQLLYKYVDDFYILNFRRCFVVAKNSMYSWVTRTFSTYLLDQTLDIKEVIMSRCFYLERYLVVCYDEKSLDRGNLKSLESKIKRDKGRKELTALCGQIFEETTYFISVKQASEDEEISERRLCVSNLEVRDRKITNNLYFILFPFRFAKGFILRWYNMRFKFSKSLKKEFGDLYTWFDSDKCTYRKRELQLQHYVDYVRSQAVVNYLIFNYSKADDVGKKDENLYEKLVFSFPLNVCIGGYDTHEYKFLLESLLSMSEVSFMQVPRISFFKAKNIKENMSKFLYENVERNTKR